MKKRFIGQDGTEFHVDEVVDFAGNLVVHYTKITTGEKYSCLIDAFSQRYRPLEDTQ